MTVQLICEGACNPNLAVVDALVAAEVRKSRRTFERVWVNEIVAGQQRRLVHTPHERRGHFYTCARCGAERTY